MERIRQISNLFRMLGKVKANPSHSNETDAPGSYLQHLSLYASTRINDEASLFCTQEMEKFLTDRIKEKLQFFDKKTRNILIIVIISLVINSSEKISIKLPSLNIDLSNFPSEIFLFLSSIFFIQISFCIETIQKYQVIFSCIVDANKNIKNKHLYKAIYMNWNDKYANDHISSHIFTNKEALHSFQSDDLISRIPFLIISSFSVLYLLYLSYDILINPSLNIIVSVICVISFVSALIGGSIHIIKETQININEFTVELDD